VLKISISLTLTRQNLRLIGEKRNPAKRPGMSDGTKGSGKPK